MHFKKIINTNYKNIKLIIHVEFNNCKLDNIQSKGVTSFRLIENLSYNNKKIDSSTPFYIKYMGVPIEKQKKIENQNQNLSDLTLKHIWEEIFMFFSKKTIDVTVT